MKIGINCGHTISGPGFGAVGIIGESENTRLVGYNLMDKLAASLTARLTRRKANPPTLQRQSRRQTQIILTGSFPSTSMPLPLMRAMVSRYTLMRAGSTRMPWRYAKILRRSDSKTAV